MAAVCKETAAGQGLPGGFGQQSGQTSRAVASLSGWTSGNTAAPFRPQFGHWVRRTAGLAGWLGGS
jgi:hypothetical protein